MIWLRMHFGRDRLEHERYPVASQDGPEVIILVSVTSALITNVEPQPGLIERKRSAQVIDNKKRSNTVQHSGTAGTRMWTQNIALLTSSHNWAGAHHPLELNGKAGPPPP